MPRPPLRAPRRERLPVAADAAARSARVSNVDYVLDFTLTGKESFSGTTTAELRPERRAPAR
jgi:aminopeptidase N